MAKRRAKRKVKKRVVAKSKAKKDSAGLWIPAGLFVGIGIGMITNQILTGTLIGLGVGFVLTFLTRLLRKK